MEVNGCGVKLLCCGPLTAYEPLISKTSSHCLCIQLLESLICPPFLLLLLLSLLGLFPFLQILRSLMLWDQQRDSEDQREQY